MEKSLEQLKQEYEKTTVLLEREKRKMQRLKNRQAYLESGSRKQRTHRLITRGAAVESIAPQTKELSEAEFYSLMENILNLPQAEHFIRSATENHARISGQPAMDLSRDKNAEEMKWSPLEMGAAMQAHGA